MERYTVSGSVLGVSDCDMGMRGRRAISGSFEAISMSSGRFSAGSRGVTYRWFQGRFKVFYGRHKMFKWSKVLKASHGGFKSVREALLRHFRLFQSTFGRMQGRFLYFRKLSGPLRAQSNVSHPLKRP